MDLNKKDELRYIGLNDYIQDCLKPIFHFHCLDIVDYDPEFMNSILMYIAMHDNRLTYFMYEQTE